MLIAAVYRDALVAQTGHGEHLRHLPTRLHLIKDLARGWPAERLETCIKAVAEAEWMIDRNVAPQLVCEGLAVALSRETVANIS
jgi:hypothetical protein